MGNGFGVAADVADIPTVATPIDMTSLAGRRVVDVSAGDFFTLLLTVPEPNTALLLLMSLLTLAMSRWKF
jgi:hypothetical protein